MILSCLEMMGGNVLLHICNIIADGLERGIGFYKLVFNKFNVLFQMNRFEIVVEMG